MASLNKNLAMSSCLLLSTLTQFTCMKVERPGKILNKKLAKYSLSFPVNTQFTCMKMERHGKILNKNLAMFSCLFLSTRTQFTCMKVERHGKILNKKLAKCSLSLLVNIHSFHLQENGKNLYKKLA